MPAAVRDETSSSEIPVKLVARDVTLRREGAIIAASGEDISMSLGIVSSGSFQ